MRQPAAVVWVGGCWRVICLEDLLFKQDFLKPLGKRVVEVAKLAVQDGAVIH